MAESKRDYYEVLGVAKGASDSEIKSAYRKVAKKYHPDANPGDKVAEQKMKEINAAYDMIINKKYDPSSGASSYGTGGYSNPYGNYTGNASDPFGFGFNPFEGFYGSYTQQQEAEPLRYQAAYNYIQHRRYNEALNTLSSIPENERTARWYYYSALAHSGLGNRVAALSNAQKACDMEPGNMQYQSLLSRLQNPGNAYSNYGRGFTINTMSPGRYCLYCCFMNALINCLCGRGVYCC